MQKIKKEEIRLTWPQTFSVVSTLPLLKIAHFVGHICLFIFLDSGKVPLGQIKHLSFSIGWFRKVTADKSRFSNICWVEKRTAYNCETLKKWLITGKQAVLDGRRYFWCCNQFKCPNPVDGQGLQPSGAWLQWIVADVQLFFSRQIKRFY